MGIGSFRQIGSIRALGTYPEEAHYLDNIEILSRYEHLLDEACTPRRSAIFWRARRGDMLTISA